MNKSDLELFKRALNEGVRNRFDKMAAECTEEIVYSERHKLAMQAIIYGKVTAKRSWSPKMKRIIAVLVAAALLLTSCGIIFRNEIRDFVEDVREFFVAVTYTEKDSDGTAIDTVYQLTYIPDGYYLEEEKITNLRVNYTFLNQNNCVIKFEQRILDGTNFVVDSKSGYLQIKDIKTYVVYHRFTDENHHYIWNDGKYSMRLKSSAELSNEEIILMLDGIIIK